MKFYLIFFLIICVGIVIYGNTLKNDFVWDDHNYVVINDYIKNLKFIPLYFISKHALARGLLAGDNYRPMLVLSYALDYFFWKLNPMGYHITNLAFHIMNAILVFYLVLIITRDRYVGLFSSLIFLTHPVQTEAVSWISGRSNVLFLFFFLLAFIAYVKHKKERRLSLYFVSVLSFLFALLSKEIAATLPFILVLYDWLYKRRENISLNAIRYYSFFLALEAYIFLRLAVLGKFLHIGYWPGSLYTTMLTMLRGLTHYIKLLLYPVGLCADYLAFPISTSIRDYRVLYSLGIIAGLLMLSLFLRKRLKYISFSILWFFITLGPVMNIFPMKTLLGERFLYLPSIGYAMAIAVLSKLFRIRFRRRPIFRHAFFFFQIGLILVYSCLTVARNTDWKDDIVFWKKVIEKYPNNPRPHINLVLEYLDDNELEKAYDEIKILLKLRPNYYMTRLLLAKYYTRIDKLEDAINELNHAIYLKPDFIDAYELMAVIYIKQKRYEEASRQFQKILVWDASNLDAKVGIEMLSRFRRGALASDE